MDTQGSPFDRDSSLLVARGLYVLRYETGGSGAEHPVAVVAPAAGFEESIQVISAPGAIQGRLEAPGAAVLVRANDNGKIRIGVKRTNAFGPVNAAFRLESVSLPPGPDQAPVPVDFRKATTRSGEAQPKARPPGSEGALFVAHVSARGDIAVKSNAWVGGPDAPARIEGLTLFGFGPELVHGEIQVLLSRQRTWTDWAGEGVFVGTRGRSEPLLGLRLRLTGDRAPSFIVHAQALFLGSAIFTRRGRELECVSETGRDPLVGLRLELQPERRATVRAANSPSERDERSRVRIFRADD